PLLSVHAGAWDPLRRLDGRAGPDRGRGSRRVPLGRRRGGRGARDLDGRPRASRLRRLALSMTRREQAPAGEQASPDPVSEMATDTLPASAALRGYLEH